MTRRTHLLRVGLPAALLFALPASARPLPVQSPEATHAEAAAPATTPTLLQRVVVLGASVSGGYGLAPEVKATVRLGDVLECALPKGCPEVIDLGDTYLFQDPHERAPKAVVKAKELDPTLVVAVDFLFWFSYRSWEPRGSRADELEAGLALLESFECPLVIGDLPDMTAALEGVGPLGTPMLTPYMIPSPEELEAMNARLRAWAVARGDVVVLPMSDMVTAMLGGERVAIRENVWEAGSIDRLLQEDLLHPNVQGTIALTLLVLDELDRARGDELAGVPFAWDAETVRARLWECTRESREKWLAREARLEALRARRERRGAEGEGGGR